jgi:hypothetical protein
MAFRDILSLASQKKLVNIQNQVNQIVKEGDSSVEAAQEE